MKYLEGINIAPKTSAQAKELIGKTVRYLCNRDIDKSGRGYFFPKRGLVSSVFRKNIVIDGDYVYLPDLVEMVEVQPAESKCL